MRPNSTQHWRIVTYFLRYTNTLTYLLTDSLALLIPKENLWDYVILPEQQRQSTERKPKAPTLRQITCWLHPSFIDNRTLAVPLRVRSTIPGIRTPSSPVDAACADNIIERETMTVCVV